MAFELANHGWNGKGCELGAPIWIKALDCIDQRHTSDLIEIVVRLTPMSESAGEMVSEAQVTLDDGVPHLDAVRPDQFSEPLQFFVGVNEWLVHDGDWSCLAPYAAGARLCRWLCDSVARFGLINGGSQPGRGEPNGQSPDRVVCDRPDQPGLWPLRGLSR